MNNLPLVSVIMPAFNAEKHIKDAIDSVLQQSYTNWELLIINDGSTDQTQKIISNYADQRITCFNQKNGGVSNARNKGLKSMKGDYFCFLDSDDIFPTNSIDSRISKFLKDPSLSFVDGKVISKTEDLKTILSTYQPRHKGKPLTELIKLSNSCLLGNTWMIKRDCNDTYQFQEGLTHAEDLSFYISISKDKNYDFVNEEILWYRRNTGSAMSNLKGLESGYRHVYKLVKSIPNATNADLTYLKKRILRIMFLSWLVDGKNPIQAFLSIFRIVGL